MREKVTEEVKAAMKAGDKSRLTTLRLIQAAIKDRDIANRGTGKDAASDDEILQLLAKMVKQREESAKAFEDGNRPELAANERAETGAAGVKDMGKVMAGLREKFAGQMDFGKASGLVKGLLG